MAAGNNTARITSLAGRPLKVGYIWQYEAAKMSPMSATALHIRAVIRGLERRGHCVRHVRIQNGIPHWSDDLETWQPIETGTTPSPAARLFESTVRGLQSRLGLPYLRYFDSVRFARACVTALRACDLLYERFWILGYGGALASRKLHLPLFYEVNGDIVAEYAQLGIELPEGHWPAIHFVTRCMFAQASHVVTVSANLRERVIERWGLKPGKVAAIPNGANIDLFARTDLDGSVLEKYGLSHHVPYVVFTGSFKPWHGLDLLVEAFQHIAQANRCVQLVLVGDGPLLPDLRKQVEALQLSHRVVFTGRLEQTEVAAILSKADVAVLNLRMSPAALSQSPLKLFEYMAAGKAIVAPAISNLQQILAHRSTAMLVPPDSGEAAAGAVVELLQDDGLRARLGAAARQQALDRHSWDSTVAALEAVFLAELNGQKHGD
jgi:glycosyltransferase involved in cell wall biosynthesis